MTEFLLFSCCLAIGFLVCTINPGSIVSWLLLIFLIGILVAPLALLLGLVHLYLRKKHPGTSSSSRPSRRTVFQYLALCGVVCLLLATRVPTRIALWSCQSRFESLLSNAPEATFDFEPLKQNVGLFDVDTYAADERGGVYFRTNECGDGIGPDIMSFGLAFKPNKEGSPFGNAHYDTFHLLGDWYTFEASDDW